MKWDQVGQVGHGISTALHILSSLDVSRLYDLCKTCGPLGQDHFRPQDHNLNKLGRGPLVLVMLHTKYQSSMPCGFRQEDFLCFPYRSLFITCNPRDRPIYGPWA